MGDAVRHTVALQAARQRLREAARQSRDHEGKNTPIDSAVPEFWNVERIPEATPRCRAGTLPMIEEELGVANMPLPIPFAAMSTAKAQ
jgi:hypothetical protein